MTGIRSIVVCLSVIATTACSSAGPESTRDDTVVAFHGARLVQLEPAPQILDVSLLVEDGRVTALGPATTLEIPANATSIDLDGRFVVPGLISTHTHISDIDGLQPRAYTDENTLRQLGVFARYGVTAVQSLGGEQGPAFAARDAQQTSTLNRARVFVSGDVVVASTPEEARSEVSRVGALAPDMIKIRVDDNLGTTTKMTPDVYEAVIDEAHQRGLRVAAHVFYLDDAKALLRAGVDMIAHSIRDQDIDAEFIALMKAGNVPYCPTLTRELSTFVYESRPAFFDDPFFQAEADPAVVARLIDSDRQRAMADSTSAQAYKAALVVAERNVKLASDAGLMMVLGTDAGPLAERFQGYFEHVEMQMMAAAGMTSAQVLRASTIDAARALRQNDIGTLAPGMWADFVVVEDNPLDDIEHLRSIASVWISGNQVKR